MDDIALTETEQAHSAAAVGARWLDEKHPGWWEWIDLERLDMCSDSSCIAAQVERELSSPCPPAVLDEHGLYLKFVVNRHDLAFDRRVELGFTSHGIFDAVYYGHLSDAWEWIILERRMRYAPVGPTVDECRASQPPERRSGLARWWPWSR